MDDKVFNLVEKMYIEFSEKFRAVDQRFETLEGNWDLRFTRLEMVVENEVLEKINALYDDRVEIKDSLACINVKLDNMAKVDENHELRIRALEGGKQAV
ncbi:MAG: hypothetical protein WC834_07360 [Eubacteriales bacterium]